VSGADRGFGFALTEELLRGGWRVFAGQYMREWRELESLQKAYGDALAMAALDVGFDGSVADFARALGERHEVVDMVVCNAGIGAGNCTPGEGIDSAAALRAFEVNAAGALRTVQALLPLTDKSDIKRLCFVSSEAGSIALAHRTRNAGYPMTKAALNMAVRMLHNHLRRDGYTFRLYHPGWMRTYMVAGTKSEAGDLEAEESAKAAFSFFAGDIGDEDRLVLVDNNFKELSF
jgi:NAD(P)-dependent dehydrogenase (short-subunit alcohol dehydrogenase family)